MTNDSLNEAQQKLHCHWIASKIPMKLIHTAIICSLVLCFSLLSDQVTTINGRIIPGKVTFSNTGDIQIADQTIKKPNVRQIIFGSAPSKSELSDISFRLYQGNWDKPPDFTKLAADKSGIMNNNHIDLSPLELDGSKRIYTLQYGDAFSRWSAPPVEGKPFTITATVEATGDGGVLLAHGGYEEGYALYLNAGKLHFGVRQKRILIVAGDDMPFPLNQPVKIIAEFTKDMNLRLKVNGREAAKVEIQSMINIRPKEGLSVGFDQRPSLVGQYRNDHHFQGEIKRMELKIMGMGIIYSGKLKIAQKGKYKFELTAASKTQLKINGQRVVKDKEIFLPIGTHKLRLTYAQLNASEPSFTINPMTLHWSGPGFSKHPLTTKVHPQTNSWQPDDTAIPSKGVLTTDGSFFAQQATDANRAHISIGDIQLERKQVGTLFMRPLSIFETRKLINKPPGVLLTDGTFTEGKLLRLNNTTVTISSILFGLKKLKRGIDAAAVVVNPIQPINPQHSILLNDGSLLYGKKYKVRNNMLELPGHPLQQKYFPLNQVTEILSGHQPSHVELAEQKWRSHSALGHQFLGERTQRNMEIITRFREAQIKLAAAEKSYAKAMRALPAAEKSEATTKLLRDAELSKIEVPKAIYKEKTELHTKTINKLKNTLKNQELSCTRDCEAFIAYNSAIHSRRYEALKNLAKLQINSVNLKPHEYEKQINQSVNHLKKVNQDIQRLKQNHLTAQTQALESDLKEMTARQTESLAWKERTAAQTLFNTAMEIFNGVDQNYQAAKFSADLLRNELSRSRRDSEMAKGTIGILEPSLQTTFQPSK